MRTPGLVALVLLASAAVLAQGQGAVQSQTAPPQFRAGVELIQLDVTVLDKDRQPVRGLTAADFTVLDNGVATSIRAFTPVELDVRTRASEAVWAHDVPPDVVTNQVGQQDGRLVVIVMDRTIPAEQPTVTARRIASAAVDALGPNDLAAVVSTKTAVVQDGSVQNFTADRARLLRAINYGDPSTGISPEQEAIIGKDNPLTDPRCLCGLCVLETLSRVAEAVQDTPRRQKVLLFIGSSAIWQSTNTVMGAGSDVGCEFRLKDARALMFAAFDRANLRVHAIDPRGLINIGPQTQAGARGGFDRPVNSGPTERLRQQQTQTTDVLTAQESLKVLPERTGGRTIVGRNNPEQIVPAIIRESEAYYVLGIERAASDRPDVVRSLEVNVGRPGLRAYTQRKYLASSPNAVVAPAAPPFGVSLANQTAIQGLLPSAGLPLGLGVTAFASPDGGTPVVRINVDAGAFARGERRAIPLEVSVMAVDGMGRSVASARQRSTVAVPRPAGSDALGATPAPAPDVNVQSHLELAPGDGIRVAVSDPATGKVASVFADVTVPAFDRVPLSLSGVSVEVPGATGPVTTTRRVFRRQEQVRAVLQIYQGAERTDAIAPVSMRVQILDAKGTAVRDQALPFAATAFTNRRADCVITLLLAKLPPGEYLLKLEASIDKRTSGRALRFAVE